MPNSYAFSVLSTDASVVKCTGVCLPIINVTQNYAAITGGVLKREVHTQDVSVDGAYNRGNGKCWTGHCILHFYNCWQYLYCSN